MGFVPLISVILTFFVLWGYLMRPKSTLNNIPGPKSTSLFLGKFYPPSSYAGFESYNGLLLGFLPRLFSANAYHLHEQMERQCLLLIHELVNLADVVQMAELPLFLAHSG